jgi:hypothetical protein
MGNSINNIKFLGRKFFGVRNLQIYDPDALNYFNANTAITSTADKNAINQYLFVNAKNQGYYSKIKQMILPLWSTATNNKWNLVNPLDTNGAFRLTFSTGWTHSSTGMTPNGTSAFAQTFLSTSAIGLNTGHLSYYSRTNSTGSYGEIGALKSSPNSYTDLGLKTATGAYIRYNNGGAPTNVANADSTGFYIGTRTASNVLKLFKNGSSIQSLTTASFATTTVAITVGATNNNGTIINYSNRECCFESIGEGLTDTEATNFTNNVNALMIYFGINTF